MVQDPFNSLIVSGEYKRFIILQLHSFLTLQLRNLSLFARLYNGICDYDNNIEKLITQYRAKY